MELVNAAAKCRYNVICKSDPVILSICFPNSLLSFVCVFLMAFTSAAFAVTLSDRRFQEALVFAALSIHRCPLLFFYFTNGTERNGTKKMDQQLRDKIKCLWLEISLSGKI